MRRFIAIILALVMVLSLSACGAANDTKGEQNKDTATKGTEATEAAKQEETKAVETTEATEQTQAADTGMVDGMRPEFKDAMDAYQDFYVDYVEFMKKYKANPTDLSLLSDYADMMSDAADMDNKFNAWDQGEMNSAELSYYLDVNARVLKMLAEVMQ